MASTTLVTFWFKTARDVNSVQLFGSWDNFSNGYSMQRESYKGCGSWTACPKFDCIICDGVQLDFSRPRSGALKQGGRYWYYFKLNDEEECYDPFKPNTSACPLLPGQVVNVLDIPVEMIVSPQCVSSVSVGWTGMMQTHQMTYDPADRHKKVLKKPSTKYSRNSRSNSALREKASELGSSIMDGGGPVQRPFRLSPVPQRRPVSASKMSTGPIQAPPATYQQPGSCFVGPTSNEMDALVESIPTDVPVLDAGLRPFGPMPSYASDDRPATRHGDAENSPIGLGISIDGVGSFPLPPNMTLFAGQVREAPTQYRWTRPASPVPRSNNNVHEWRFPRPSPLRSNPNSLVLPKPMHLFPPTESDALSPSTFPAPVSRVGEEEEEEEKEEEEEEQKQERDDGDGDHDFDLHPGYGVSGAGLYDMVSPTFTATTISPLDDCFSLSGDDDKDPEPRQPAFRPNSSYTGDLATYMSAEETLSSEPYPSAGTVDVAETPVVHMSAKCHEYPNSLLLSRTQRQWAMTLTAWI